MENHEISQRAELALTLLRQLDESNHDLAGLSLEADAACETALTAAKRETDDRVRVKRDLLHQRIGELKTCLSNITGITNEWNRFTHDPEAQRHWSYPFRLSKLGRETNLKLKNEQDRITSLILQNRLLEEEIRRLGDTVQRDALSVLKGASGHAALMAALERKQKIVDDLRLLLPTIPKTAICTLDSAHPTILAERLV